MIEQQHTNTDPRLTVTGTELAGLFGVVKSTITEWKRRGMPTCGTRYIVPQCIAWHACFGPGRCEKARDEYLRVHIRRLSSSDD